MNRLVKYVDIKTGEVSYFKEENIGPSYTIRDLIKMGKLPEMQKGNGKLKAYSELSEETQKLFSDYDINPEEYEGGLT